MKKILHVASGGDGRRIVEVNGEEYQITSVPFLKPYKRFRFLEEDSLIRLLATCEDELRAENFDGIYYSTDIGSLIASILCEKYGFAGPSVESVFNCFHKYHTRRKTDSKLVYDVVDEKIYRKPFDAETFYIKAPYSSFGTLGFMVRDFSQYAKSYENRHQYLVNNNKPIIELIKTLPQLKNKEYASENVFMREEFIDLPQITIEGFVFNGAISIIAITDTNNLPNSKRIDNFCTPGKFIELNKAVEKQVESDIEAVRLNNSFFNAEYWVDGNHLILVEINSRSAISFNNIYKRAYGIDVFKAGLELCVGKTPDLKIIKHEIAAQIVLTTMANGRASNFFYFSKEREKDMDIYFNPDDEIMPDSDYGVLLAHINLSAQSYEELEKKVNYLRKKYLLSD